MHNVLAIFVKESVELRSANSTGGTLRLKIGEIVLDTLGSLAIGIFASLHERIDDLRFVEDTVANDKSRLERDTLFSSNHLIGVVRVAFETANIGVMASRRNPEDDFFSSIVKDWLNDLDMSGLRKARLP